MSSGTGTSSEQQRGQSMWYAGIIILKMIQFREGHYDQHGSHYSLRVVSL
jgi:hypothetical protein